VFILLDKFQLVLNATDPELFKKATSELGTLFYKVLSGNGVDSDFVYDVAYFSGSRVVRYTGKITDDLKRLCIVSGFEVEEILFDEDLGTLKIKQRKGE